MSKVTKSKGAASSDFWRERETPRSGCLAAGDDVA